MITDIPMRESALNEAVDKRLRKAITQLRGYDKKEFSKIIKKLSIDFNNSTLDKAIKITNRDKRLKDKDYLIFFLMKGRTNDQLMISRGGEVLLASDSEMESMSWKALIESSDLIYALDITDPSISTRDLQYARHKRNSRNQSTDSDRNADPKVRYNKKVIDNNLFIDQGDGTFLLNYDYLNEIYDEIIKSMEKEFRTYSKLLRSIDINSRSKFPRGDEVSLNDNIKSVNALVKFFDGVNTLVSYDRTNKGDLTERDLDILSSYSGLDDFIKNVPHYKKLLRR